MIAVTITYTKSHDSDLLSMRTRFAKDLMHALCGTDNVWSWFSRCF